MYEKLANKNLICCFYMGSPMLSMTCLTQSHFTEGMNIGIFLVVYDLYVLLDTFIVYLAQHLFDRGTLHTQNRCHTTVMIHHSSQGSIIAPIMIFIRYISIWNITLCPILGALKVF